MEGSPYYPPQLHPQQQIPPRIPPNYMMSSSSPHLLMSPQPLNHNSFPPSSNHSSQHHIYPAFYPHAQSQPPQPPSAQPEFQYNPAPPHHQVRQVRRYKTIKRLVQIPQGKLVLNCPVPIQYLERVPLRDPKEFNMMRYTAITCDANEFHQKNYTLRQEIMNRETEIAICITMYNEDEILLSRTLHGIMKNLTQLTKRYRSPIWGEHAWQKVVICIIADGREKIHPRVLDMLSVLGIYQEGIAKSTVNEKPVHAHLYEYTSQLSLTPDLTYKGAINDIVPAQIIFCLKEKNQRKINSHRWFFQAICPVLQPNVCILMDVGTRPGPHSIYKLWLPFEKHRDIGGACGEVRAMTGKGNVYLLNPLVAAQNFEYKISNILDKPLESVLGYIQVLPGAFSAYRYAAIQNDMTGEGPLKKYFLGDTSSGDVSEGIFEANMYLAEDRILCYELVAKAQSQWRLYYVSAAYGETDVPFSVAEFISQRRRWLNGSFFAGVYSLVHWGKILNTNHTTGRKCLLIIELVYLCINWLFSWFALGNFFLSFYILTGSLAVMQQPPFSAKAADIVHTVLTYIYAVLIICLFLIAMGNRPQGSQGSYGLIMIFFSLLMIYVIFSSAWIVYVGISTELSKPQSISSLLSNGPFRDIIISMASTFGVFILSGIIFLDPWHMLTSFVQYFLLTPSYINILNTYAFCNTHDVSWGTKDIFENIPYLGHVKTKADQTTAEIVLPEQKDVGYLYEESFKNLQKKEPKNNKKYVDPKTRQEDYYRNFRTRLVVCWIFSNLILVIVICTMDNLGKLGNFDEKTNIYMSFILWSVAALSVFRFIGSCVYRVLSFF
ncbi:Chitin synthase, class 2 [Mucor circinelloides]